MAENDEMDPELAAMMAEHGVSAKVAAPAGTAPGEQTGETPAPIWPIGENRFWNSREQVKKRLRERTRAFIKPENALVVVRRLPGEGETTHCILKGDFVLGDLLPYLLEDGWVCPHMRVATLGMSVENGKTLAGLRRSGRVGRLTLVLSHYFEAVNKSTMYPGRDGRVGWASGAGDDAESREGDMLPEGATGGKRLAGDGGVGESAELGQFGADDDLQ
jgi:hypothetical protein